MERSLPAASYVAEAAWRRERRRIFGRTWLLAGHVDQLPSPAGACAVTVAGWPLVLVRSAEGALRAFHNVCRHRAGPLLWEGEAEAGASLRCRYHGWRYALDDGALLQTPAFGGEVDRACLGLHAVHLAEWRGLLFVHLGASPSPLARALGDLPAQLEGLELEGFRLRRSATHHLTCNWKTYVENYLEGFHIPFLHPRLSEEVRVSEYTVEVHHRCALHRVPTRSGAVSSGLWAWLWPNLAVNVYGEGLSLERMDPTGPRTVAIRYLYLAREGLSDADLEGQIALSAEVTAEDARIVEAVQRNLEAGIYQAGPLSPRHEQGVAAFHAMVRSSTRREAP